MDVLDFCLLTADNRAHVRQLQNEDGLKRARRAKVRKQRAREVERLRRERLRAERGEPEQVVLYARERRRYKAGEDGVYPAHGLSVYDYRMARPLKAGVWYTCTEIAELSGYARGGVAASLHRMSKKGFYDVIKNAGEVKINRGLSRPYNLYRMTDKMIVACGDILGRDWLEKNVLGVLGINE